MRRTEVVARAQQFFVGAIGPDAEADYDLPGVNTREADFGVNYFLRDGMKGIFSYGRQFSPAGNFNQWSFGLAYRFLFRWAMLALLRGRNEQALASEKLAGRHALCRCPRVLGVCGSAGSKKRSLRHPSGAIQRRR